MFAFRVLHEIADLDFSTCFACGKILFGWSVPWHARAEVAAQKCCKSHRKQEGTLSCQSVLETLAGCIPPWTSGWITSQGPPCLVRIHECHDGIHQDISTQNRKASSTDLGMAGMAMRAMREGNQQLMGRFCSHWGAQPKHPESLEWRSTNICDWNLSLRSLWSTKHGNKHLENWKLSPEPSKREVGTCDQYRFIVEKGAGETVVKGL